MKVVHILHHSISPYTGQYPEGDPLYYNSGLPMKYARAVRAAYPAIEIECWRPECTAQNVHVWQDENARITHRIFPSIYGRVNLEYSRAMLKAVREEAGRGECSFFVHGVYNLHAFLLAPILSDSPAIVQSHGGFPAGVLFHRTPHHWLRAVYWPIAPFERRSLSRYRHFFAISQEERAYLTRLCPGSAVHFSPTGVYFDIFSPGDRRSARTACGVEPDAPLLLFVGRLIEEKGVEYLLEAYQDAAKRIKPMPQLVIIGSGPLEDSLRRRADELGVSRTVRFTGNVANNELPQWYRAADVTVIPSLLEWFGAVAVESLACGTPIIGTEAGGLVDIVAEFECGTLVPPEDAAALAEAIVEALTRSPLPPPNIARGRSAFDWSAKTALMMQVWEHM